PLRLGDDRGSLAAHRRYARRVHRPGAESRSSLTAMLHPIAPIVDRKIRFAVVGCGRISPNHFGAIRKHAAHAELIGVCDSASAALAKAEAETGAPGYLSLTTMLAAADPDVVVLATPSGLHPEQAIQVAESRRHVMTEKPMATRWRDAQRMVTAC